MRRDRLAGLALACLPAVPAQAAERWTAVSNTAMAITGNVTFAPDRITFENGESLALAKVKVMPGFDGYGQKVRATLFRVTEPADPVLKHGTRLCGGDTPRPVAFAVVWRHEPFGGDVDPRDVAFFTDGASLASEGAGCATYGYDAGY